MVGVVVRTYSPAVVEMIGLAGFDYVWIDLEHGSAGFDVAETLVRAADCVGIDSMIRIPDKAPASVLRALETGASMVCVPHVETPREAEAIVAAARYFPLGTRGYTTASRGLRYGFGAAGQALLDQANERVMVVVQVESPEGLRNVEAIAAVPGVDVVFAGIGDLSQHLGKPGNYSDPEVVAAGRRIADAARRHGKIGGAAAADPEALQRWMALGARLFFCSVDIVLLAQALRSAHAQCTVDTAKSRA